MLRIARKTSQQTVTLPVAVPGKANSAETSYLALLENFGLNLKEARKSADLTQAQVSERTGIDQKGFVICKA